VPELSTLPSATGAPVPLLTKSTSKVRSRAPAAKNGVLLTRNGASAVSCGVMPCSGWAMETIAKPCEASVAEIARPSVRLRVTPCWKITSGQPAAGLVRPEAALGTVISTGTRTVPVATGRVLRKVRKVDGLVAPSAPAQAGTVPQAAPFQNVLSGAFGFSADGADR